MAILPNIANWQRIHTGRLEGRAYGPNKVAQQLVVVGLAQCADNGQGGLGEGPKVLGTPGHDPLHNVQGHLVVATPTQTMASEARPEGWVHSSVPDALPQNVLLDLALQVVRDLDKLLRPRIDVVIQDGDFPRDGPLLSSPHRVAIIHFALVLRPKTHPCWSLARPEFVCCVCGCGRGGLQLFRGPVPMSRGLLRYRVESQIGPSTAHCCCGHTDTRPPVHRCPSHDPTAGPIKW